MRLRRRRLAANYLRTLGIVDQLIAVDQLAEARRQLARVDPIEARSLANELETGSEQGIESGKLSLLSAPSRRKPW